MGSILKFCIGSLWERTWVLHVRVASGVDTDRGFSNVPWRKRAFGPGAKYGFFEEFLGILGALCMGKGAPLVRYLCTI